MSSRGAGEEKSEHMISGPGRLIAYVERLAFTTREVKDKSG